jgi:hypothetical protein
VNSGHLRGEHGLNPIARLDPRDEREHEIRPAFVRARTVRANVDELTDETSEEVIVRRAERFH